MNGEMRSWIAGVGMIPFRKEDPDPFPVMGQRAAAAALEDAGLAPADIDEVVCGTGYGGPLPGQRIVGPMGMSGVRVVNAENACSSGTGALVLGTEAITSGRARRVLVIGIDKLSTLGKGALPLEPSDVEVQQGMVMPALYAMRAQRYLHQTEATVEDLANVTVKVRRHSAHNPYAQRREPTTVEEVLAARPVADPLTLPMCCPRGDGAAAVVLSADRGRHGVGFTALALQSGTYTSGYRDMSRSELSERVIAAAYAQAGIGPQDLDVAEIHDAFAIAELMYYEALGLAAHGEGWKLLRAGDTDVGGRVAVNPSGGLMARGHPVGATGVAQVCEVVWQLTGQADGRQVTDPRVGITHCTGGGISGYDHGACGVTVLARAQE